jgi:hypothetical protein
MRYALAEHTHQALAAIPSQISRSRDMQSNRQPPVRQNDDGAASSVPALPANVITQPLVLAKKRATFI